MSKNENEENNDKEIGETSDERVGDVSSESEGVEATSREATTHMDGWVIMLVVKVYLMMRFIWH